MRNTFKKFTNLHFLKWSWLTAAAIFSFPIFFMSVRHGVHIFLFLLLAIVLYQIYIKNFNFLNLQTIESRLIVAAFSAPLFAVFISQVFRDALYLPAFDGPARIFIAGIIFLYLRKLDIPYLKILGLSIPLSLIATYISFRIYPEASALLWGGRYATYFVDPNTLGSQSLILSLISLFLIKPLKSESPYLLLLKLAGCAIGLYLTIGSGSRGGWMLAPFVFLLMIFVRINDINRSALTSRPKMWAQTAWIFFVVLICAATLFYFSERLSLRVVSAYFEIRNWFTGENLDSSAGTRLSMWIFSFQFASESLLFGYGEEKNMLQQLSNSPLNIPANEIVINTMALTGPHSDILSKLLSSGLIGLLAYLSLLFVPFYLFYAHRNSLCAEKRRAARIGMYYITGVFIAGLTNEQLSLKYLCTFYGLMTATLLAQVLQASANGLDGSFAHPSASPKKAPMHG
jgi:O-antigen ligase